MRGYHIQMVGLNDMPIEILDTIAEYVDFGYGRYLVIPIKTGRKKSRSYHLSVVVFPFYRYVFKEEDDIGFVYPNYHYKRGKRRAIDTMLPEL